jgi:hypothetical protein
MATLQQIRIVLVGRSQFVQELAFDTLGAQPTVGSAEFKWLGPVDASAIKTLAVEAEHYVRRLGYSPDTFGLIGLGRTKVIALVPRHPAVDEHQGWAVLAALGCG